ncbi:nocobactin polyketide synthase NbtC [Antrihabitans cavernicola]|uniref:SDR family NAD(P)-dependent oxidoreductase n=1 Tax=Antrihabitans cavernicola TaxID=2495913 RepID=A0A5A7S5Y9_9NOCA|nr:nocobactin polyketide synthase NbtC [Spelaeibacter cavernicola]KAA0021540.1 SDR family NAD(P)-dependent oxidoreductase [Spelaeibacter cavernicola]
MADYRLPDGTVPVLLSSDSAELLRREAAAILSYVEDRPNVTPNAVSDALFRTRTARRYRALAMVTDRDRLIDALRAVADGTEHVDVVVSAGAATSRRIGYVFPGQGSQYPGMGTLYYRLSPAFKTAVDECEAIFQELYSISPLAYLLGDGEFGDDVTVVQPALFMQMIGLAAMWRDVGVAPAAAVGHSQGEIAAACIAEMQTLADGVRVVTLRAKLVDTLEVHGYSMAVLGVDRDECEDLLARNSGWAELSVINSAHVLAISGERPTVLEMVAELTAKGKFAKEIRVAYPAHTSIVSKFRAEMGAELLGKLDNPEFAEPQIPCIGATLGGPITADLPVGEYWYWNLRNKVRFDRAITDAAAHGVDTYVEIADHPALLLSIQENLSTVPEPRAFQVIGTSRRKAETLREFTRNVAAVAVNDAGYRWDALRKSGDDTPRPPLFDFPNTSMAAKKLWARFDYAVEPSPVREVQTHPPQQLVESWVRLERRKLVRPRSIAIVDHTGRCDGFAADVIAAAPRQGATAAFSDVGADTAVILLPPGAGEIGGAVDEFAGFVGEQTWLPSFDGGIEEVWLVTVGGEAVLPGDSLAPFHAAAASGFRCLASEHVGVAFRHLDLAAGEELSGKTLLAAIHTASEPELAVRDGGIYAKRLVVEDATHDDPLDVAALREVVIVGGTGKLGLEFCEQFALRGAGRITLLSRSGGSAAALEQVTRSRSLGDTEVVVRVCDVGDEGAVRALAAEYAVTPADLIVHAAVDYDAAASGDVRAAAAAKVIGIDTVLQHFPTSDDVKVVLCSSLSATLGGRGHLVYAGVNRLLDALAYEYRGRGIDCVSVQWGLWRETGSSNADAESRISGAGLLPIAPADAVAAGITARAGNSIVAAANWSRIREIFAVYGFGPTFSELDDQGAAPAEVVAPQPDPEPTVPGPVDTAERVRFALRTVMGMDTAEAIDGSVPLVALGLDSLQALDLRKRIESELKRDLPVTAILGGASLDEVVSLIG